MGKLFRSMIAAEETSPKKDTGKKKKSQKGIAQRIGNKKYAKYKGENRRERNKARKIAYHLVHKNGDHDQNAKKVLGELIEKFPFAVSKKYKDLIK